MPPLAISVDGGLALEAAIRYVDAVCTNPTLCTGASSRCMQQV